MSDRLDVPLRDNTSQRLPCVLILDGSGSMAGAPINELNAGLRILEEELKKDDIASARVRLLVLRVGGNDEVQVLSEWTDAAVFDAPSIYADGSTPLGKAARLALTMIEEEKARYRSTGIAYNRPWLFILTDGAPTDRGWEEAADECREAEQRDKVTVFCIGTADADLSTLARFSTRPPAKLDGMKYREMFVWLSNSTRSASKAAQGTNVQLAPPGDWTQVSA